MADTKFRWNYSEDSIIRRKGFNSPCYRQMAEALARYCDPFVPMDTGTLASEYTTFTGKDAGYVRYDQIYAHYQYTGDSFDFSIEKHPKASSHWDKAMMAVKGQQFIAEIDRIRKRWANNGS